MEMDDGFDSNGKEKLQAAFPVTYPASQAGMTLLDYFAGQALVGLLSRGCSTESAGLYAYQVAQLMMEAREK